MMGETKVLMGKNKILMGHTKILMGHHIAKCWWGQNKNIDGAYQNIDEANQNIDGTNQNTDGTYLNIDGAKLQKLHSKIPHQYLSLLTHFYLSVSNMGFLLITNSYYRPIIWPFWWTKVALYHTFIQQEQMNCCRKCFMFYSAHTSRIAVDIFLMSLSVFLTVVVTGSSIPSTECFAGTRLTEYL